MPRLTAWWHRAFLIERPSLELSLFRLAVAITVGCHMIPSFFHLEDNYLSTAFKEYNSSFFPVWALELAARSPDWLVCWMVGLFAFSWCSFLIGFCAQLSCLVMTACCYYFYALNSLHIGTLSFDILLVTLSLLWITGYHGDWLSVDNLWRGEPSAYRRMRPFFIQRLLQLQIAWTFFYTALSKLAAGGNWLTDNPYYYLMRYPPMGVVREFPLREMLAQHPTLCYALGLTIMLCEFSLPVLLFIRRTRPAALVLGIVFHLLLLMTLHVPTIFFFLFPPQLLLFVEPETLVRWIEYRRARWAMRGRAKLLYDGGCGFCLASVARLAVLDVFGRIEPIDFHTVPDVAGLHPDLTPQKCHSRMQLVEPVRLRSGLHPEGTRRVETNGRLSEGFLAFRRMSLRIPLLWPAAPLLYLPGAGWTGQRIYDGVAARRYLFHAGRRCATNQCGVTAASEGASSKT